MRVGLAHLCASLILSRETLTRLQSPESQQEEESRVLTPLSLIESVGTRIKEQDDELHSAYARINELEEQLEEAITTIRRLNAENSRMVEINEEYLKKESQVEVKESQWEGVDYTSSDDETLSEETEVKDIQWEEEADCHCAPVASEILRLTRGGVNKWEVARQVGCTPTHVYKITKLYGVDYTSSDEEKPSEETEVKDSQWGEEADCLSDQGHIEYACVAHKDICTAFVRGDAIRDIASKYACHVRTVSKIAKKYGITVPGRVGRPPGHFFSIYK